MSSQGSKFPVGEAAGPVRVNRVEQLRSILSGGRVWKENQKLTHLRGLYLVLILLIMKKTALFQYEILTLLTLS